MIAALVLAAATASAAPESPPQRPPDAIYGYTVLIAGVPEGSSSVTIDGSGGSAIVMSERAAFALPKFSAAATLHYDPVTLNETAYSADFELATGAQHVDVSFAPGTATLTFPQHRIEIAADATAPVELIGDNLAGSELFVPAIVHAGRLTTITLVAINGARAIVAQVVQPVPAPDRPASVPAGDALLALQVAGSELDYWYDPQTYVVHDLAIPAQQAEFRLTSTTALGGVPPAPAALATALPEPRAHFSSREVSFASADGIRLAGTLTVPDRGTSPFPAVVLVHGSGALDRDETIGPNAIFEQLSRALSNAGYAVLRYDKRGVAKSGGNPLGATREKLLADVHAAFRFAQSRPQIDPHRVVLLGHSEGGELVPTAALQEPAVAGLILLAPPALPGGRIIMQQVLASNPPAKRAALIQVETAALAKIRRSSELRDAWLRSSIDLDPIVDIAKLRVPLLILQGASDAQVLVRDLPRISAAARAHNPAVTVLTFAGDNHLFEASLPGTAHDPLAAVHQYLTVPAHIDQRVIDALLAWLTTTRGPANRPAGGR
jgi:dienelactone hydrolase